MRYNSTYLYTDCLGNLRLSSLNNYRTRRVVVRETYRPMYITQPYEGKIVVTLRRAKICDSSRLHRKHMGDLMQQLHWRNACAWQDRFWAET